MADPVMMPVHLRRRKRRVFNERRFNMANLPDRELYKRYRFTRATINRICDLLRPQLEHRTARSQALNVQMQVLITLRFLASGSFQEVIGDTLGVEKSTVSRVIQRVTAALCDILPEVIRFPNAEERQEIKEDFRRLAHFPAVIGCIDGTHIRIQAPVENEQVYVNRKGFHSINVQAVCSHKGKFTNVVAKWPGSSHDSHIFNQSALKTNMEERAHRIQDGFLLGDSGYACKPYLLTPYNRPRDHQQVAFNVAHKRTRATVERVFGWWKRRFHILHSEIRMRPDRVCRIIGACAVLHNIAVDCHEAMEDDGVPVLDAAVNYDGPEDGRSVRDHIARTYF